MKGWGIALLAIGVLAALASLFMPTSLDTAVPDLGPYGVNLPRTDSVYNLGLLQHQLLVFVAGCSTAIIGAVFAAAGSIDVDPARTFLDAAGSEPKPPLPVVTPDTSIDIQPDWQPTSDRTMYVVIGAGAVLLAIFILIATLDSASERVSGNMVMTPTMSAQDENDAAAR